MTDEYDYEREFAAAKKQADLDYPQAPEHYRVKMAGRRVALDLIAEVASLKAGAKDFQGRAFTTNYRMSVDAMHADMRSTGMMDHLRGTVARALFSKAEAAIHFEVMRNDSKVDPEAYWREALVVQGTLTVMTADESKQRIMEARNKAVEQDILIRDARIQRRLEGRT